MHLALFPRVYGLASEFPGLPHDSNPSCSTHKSMRDTAIRRELSKLTAGRLAFVYAMPQRQAKPVRRTGPTQAYTGRQSSTTFHRWRGRFDPRWYWVRGNHPCRFSNFTLVLAGRPLPINQIYKFPGILSELDFQLSFLIDCELGFWIQNAGAFLLVLVI